MRHFVDSGAYIAILDRSDQHHQESVDFLKRLKPSDHLHTSNYIVDEVITWLRFKVSHDTAVQFAESIQKSRLIQIHYVDILIEQEAVKLFKGYEDKRFSFTDCVSFAVCKRNGIEQIFGFDEEFKKAGWVLVP